MDDSSGTFAKVESTPPVMPLQPPEFLKRSALPGAGLALGQLLLTAGNPGRSNEALATVPQVAIEKVAVRLRKW